MAFPHSSQEQSKLLRNISSLHYHLLYFDQTICVRFFMVFWFYFPLLLFFFPFLSLSIQGTCQLFLFPVYVMPPCGHISSKAQRCVVVQKIEFSGQSLNISLSLRTIHVLLNKALGNLQEVFLTVETEILPEKPGERILWNPGASKGLALLSVCFLATWEDPSGQELLTALRETGAPVSTWYLAHGAWSIVIDRDITEVSYFQLVMDKLDTELDHSPVAVYFLRIPSHNSSFRHLTLNINILLPHSQASCGYWSHEVKIATPEQVFPYS